LHRTKQFAARRFPANQSYSFLIAPSGCAGMTEPELLDQNIRALQGKRFSAPTLSGPS